MPPYEFTPDLTEKIYYACEKAREAIIRKNELLEEANKVIDKLWKQLQTIKLQALHGTLN